MQREVNDDSEVLKQTDKNWYEDRKIRLDREENSISLIANTKISLFLMDRVTPYAPPNSERETTKHSKDGGQ